MVELGDAAEAVVPPALELAQNVHQSSHHSRLYRLLRSLTQTLLHEGWNPRLIARLLKTLPGAADHILSMIPAEEGDDHDHGHDHDSDPDHEALSHYERGLDTTGETIREGGGGEGPSEELQLYRRAVAFLVSDQGAVTEIRELELELALAGQRTLRLMGADGDVEGSAFYDVVAAGEEKREEKEGEEEEKD